MSGCLAPHTPFRPRLRVPSAPYSFSPHTPFRPILPSAPYSLPPQPPVRPMLPSAPASLPIVGVRGCLSADAECDGAALASCSASMCECAARMSVWRLAGSSAAELCARGCAACSARTFAFDGTQRTVSSSPELWLTHLWHDVCATNPARPAPTRPSSMRSDAKSRPHTDFTPAAVWVEGHLGTKRFLCMTCIKWVVKPAAAMTWRIW